MFVECLLQAAWSPGLLQEERLCSPTGTAALLSLPAHCLAFTRCCTSSMLMHQGIEVADALGMRKGNSGCILEKGLEVC